MTVKRDIWNNWRWNGDFFSWLCTHKASWKEKQLIKREEFSDTITRLHSTVLYLGEKEYLSSIKFIEKHSGVRLGSVTLMST